MANEKPSETRDWAKWLPPGPLPDTGPKTFRAGQVWAWRSPSNPSDPIVFRVLHEGNTGKQNAEPLARPTHGPGLCWMDAEHCRSAVLVADVGCEPTPPEILYGPPIGDRPVPAAGQRWRTPKDKTLWGLTKNAVFTLQRFEDGNGCWKAFGPAINGQTLDDWNMSPVWFEEGGPLEFVDHGSPSLTPAPTAAPEPAVMLWTACTRMDCPEHPMSHEHRWNDATPTVWETRYTAPAAPVPVRRESREVSADGKTYVDYERLTDGDAFEAYPHWRVLVDGKVTQEHHPKPTLVNYEATARRDAEVRLLMDSRDYHFRDRREAANTASPSPLANRRFLDGADRPWMFGDPRPLQGSRE